MDFSHSFYSSIIYVRKREWEGEGKRFHSPPPLLSKLFESER